MITLYKVFRPNWMDKRELLSFEVTDHRYLLTYAIGKKTTIVEPAFFFLSRAHAVNYLSRWMFNEYRFALDAEIWRCTASSIYPAPKYVPLSDCVDIFETFWKTYYTSKEEDLRDVFTGLQRVPRLSAMAFTFTVHEKVLLPKAIRELAERSDD